MNIAYTTNELFAAKVAASICSVFENNKDMEEIVIYIIGESLSDKTIENYDKLSRKYKRDIRIIQLDDINKYLDFDFDTSGWSQIIVARLALDQMLPEEIERILYLDGDTINIAPLNELWHADMQGAVLGACIEATADMKRRIALGMETIPYINSGVLLMDLKQWREQKTGKRILEFYKENNGKLVSCDQDAINGASKGNIFYLSPRYNFYNIYWTYPYKTLKKRMKNTFYYSKAEVKSAIDSPAIIHYLGEERPWRKGNRHKYRGEYEKYLQKTPWKNEKMEEGWKLYFVFWNIFNVLIRPFPELRYQIINHLIPVMMKWRSKQLKKKKAITKG